MRFPTDIVTTPLYLLLQQCESFFDGCKGQLDVFHGVCVGDAGAAGHMECLAGDDGGVCLLKQEVGKIDGGVDLFAAVTFA